MQAQTLDRKSGIKCWCEQFQVLNSRDRDKERDREIEREMDRVREESKGERR